jgi:phage terminase large subunit-like protein
MSRRKDDVLQQIAASPASYRRALMVDTDRGAQRFADVMDAWQREDFEALDPAWERIVNRNAEDGIRRAYFERARGHSKTTDLAVMTSWPLFASQRKITGVHGAADKDQARLLRDAIDNLVRLNPWLGQSLEVQAYRVRNIHTDSSLEIMSADAASSWGQNPDFVTVDELSVWPKRDLWDSLFSAADKRRHCVLVVISNAGYGKGESWHWDQREKCRADPEWRFVHLDGPVASWITKEQIDHQRRHSPPLVFQRVWLNEWTTGDGDALSEHDIKAAVTLPGPLLEPEKGWVYVAGVDLGLKRDAAALAIVGVDVGYYEEIEQERPKLTPAQRYLGGANSLDMLADESAYCGGTGRFKLASLHLWQPPGNGRKVEIEPIEAAILSIYQAFGLACVGLDPWQAAYLIERLQKRELPVESADFTGPNLKQMASILLDGFNQRQIELYSHPKLLADLRALRVEEKSYGVRLTSPRGPNGHGDAATALAIALLIAKRYAFSAPTRINGPLICWP